MDDEQLFRVLTDINSKLSEVSTGVSLLNHKLEDHTHSDSTNFSSIAHNLDTLEDKVDVITVEMAENRGRDKAFFDSTRKAGAMWGGGIASLVSALGVIFNGCAG